MKRPFRIATAVTTVFVLAYTGYFHGLNDTRYQWGTGINHRMYPSGAIKFISENRLHGNMYNTYCYGGALIWSLYPEYRVFSDGRSTLYGDAFYKTIISFEGAPSPEKWNILQDIFGLTFAVIKRENPQIYQSIIQSEGGWRLVYWDSVSLVLARNIPEHSRIIEKHRYDMVTPDNALSLSAEWNNMNDTRRSTLISELERNLRQNPESIQAIISLVYIHIMKGEYDRAEELAVKGIDVDGRHARLHAALGEIYLMKGRRSDALREFRKAAPIISDYKKRIKEIEEK